MNILAMPPLRLGRTKWIPSGIVCGLVLALTGLWCTATAQPLPQFAYRDVILHFTASDGRPVAGAEIYGYCSDLNLIWPRRDDEVNGRNDVLWQGSFAGKTGNDGSAKATIPPGNWRFFAAGTRTDGAIALGWTEAHSPAPGENIEIKPMTSKHWTFASPSQVALWPRRLYVRPQQFPAWLPIYLNSSTSGSLQIDLSAGPVDFWIADDASASTHPGYALAMPTLSSQVADGVIAAAPRGIATIVFKGGKGQSVLSWECPFQPGLEDEISLCEGARVVVSAGEYFLSYRRPISNGLTATFIAQKYSLQPGQSGSLDLDSALSGGVDQNTDDTKPSHLFYGQLYLADANGHMLGNLLDAANHTVPVSASVSVGGIRYSTRAYDPAGDHENGEEEEEDEGQGLSASPFAPKWQMCFVADKSFPPIAANIVATWEFTAPTGILPKSTFVREAPVAVYSASFSTEVPRVVQRQAANLLMQADGMARTMEQVVGHGRSKYNVTQLWIVPKGGGASSPLTGLRTRIPPKIFYSNHPMYAHTIVHETGHNFGFKHSGLMEAVVEVVRCGGTTQQQISQQPMKWLFLDRMNGLHTHNERKARPNVGLFQYFYAKSGANFLRFLSAHEQEVTSAMLKQNIPEDDIIAGFLSLASGSDATAIGAKYGLTLNPQLAPIVMQQIRTLCANGVQSPKSEPKSPSHHPEHARSKPSHR